MVATPSADDGLFQGGGAMGALAGSFDWSTSPLGPPAAWSAPLRSAVSICLGSRYPIAIYWGAERALIYNDAWSPILGRKHPWALGRPAREVWSEIWEIIDPQFRKVFATGEATWSEDQLLPMLRHGYTEECYFNYTFSPIREHDRVGGIFNAVIETTHRVVDERRARLLRELATTTEARTVVGACRAAAEVLRGGPHDVPFAAVYVVEDEGRSARLVASTCDGLRPEGPLDLGRPDLPWGLSEAQRAGGAVEVAIDEALLGPGWRGPGYPWPEPPARALVLPLRTGVRSAGLLVAGVSPRRALDETHRAFFDRLAGHLSIAIGVARGHEEERQRTEALAELDRAKTLFFSNVSHELRTPLTLMLGPLQGTLDGEQGPLTPAQREQLEVAQRNGQRLLKLVNTLLDFTRFEAGRAQATFEPTALGPFTADVASAFRSAFQQAGVQLSVQVAEGAEPAWVDPDLWEKVVLNLVSNAFKFTLAGRVSVSLREDAGGFELEVDDTGVGIPAHELPNLFKRFHRIEGVRGRSHEGTGIGLALVHELVRLHGGTIRAESAVGRGTRFVVRLRKGCDHLPPDRLRAARAAAPSAARREAFVQEARHWSPAASAPAAPSSAGREDRPRVLVADDNADMRAYVGRLLEPTCEVVAVADGAEALERARSGAFELVLTDVMMPGLDGFALLQALRDAPATRTLPVILLSARAGEEARVEGIACGADDYLTKPFVARELVARVEAHLALARMRREAARREQALREQAEGARAQLEQASRSKDQFLAMLGHELRNPLAPILSAVELLKRRGGADPAVRRSSEVIDRQVQHLTRLVDDLLEVSRITSGKIRLQLEEVDLRTVIDAAVETSRPLIDARRQLLTIEAGPALRVQADPTRLAQVFTNLLNNASKYTPEGGRIRVSAAREGAESVVRVRDDGVGLPPELLETIFELFVQADSSLDRSLGGLGLGLTLARALVTMHGGSVRAESAGRGAGSEFVVRLPALEEAPPTRAVPRPVPEQPAPRRILVVDDNVDSAETLAETLRFCGHDVRAVHDGAAALEAARASRPDVVLLDIGLPLMDGYEVATRLRREHGPSLAIVALTGYGQEDDRRRSQAAGFDHHLVKPLRLAALEALLRELPAGR